MGFVLYNTYSKKDEEFSSLKKNEVTMYTCGPTVYGRPHIGNYSSFLMADLLRRWLEVSGYQVKHVKNITDVGHLLHDSDSGDDKIQKQAEQEKMHPLEIARRYTDQYLADEKALNMLEPAVRPRASEFIKEQLEIVKKLLEQGNAYETDDGFYFAVETFPAYGKLSGNTLQNLNAGARVAVDTQKKHPADFALWKKCVGENGRHVLRWSFASGELSHTEGEDASSGFPGWHIECSAMSRALLGDQLDLHTGGEDNIFPHHECEIAQSESFTGKQFVRTWLHKRRIDLGDAKMSKSLGNVLTLPDIVAKGFSPLDLRYYLLSVHYRTNLKFTWKGMEDAKKARGKISDWAMRDGAPELVAGGGDSRGEADAKKIAECESAFTEAMNADLNTPAALAAVFDCVHYINGLFLVRDNAKEAARHFAKTVRETFGCFDEEVAAIPADVQSLLDERAAARARKDFAESDRLRDAIKKLGFDVKDSSQGQTVKKA